MDTVIKTGTSTPDFQLPDLEGRQHNLSDYQGKIVVVNFWSWECPSSLRADQLLAPMLETWGEDVVLLSVASNANETAEELKTTAAERKLAPVLHDSQQEVARAYGAVTTPHFFVIDPEGKLRYQGALDDVSFRQAEAKQNYLYEAVEAVLAGERPTIGETPPYGCTVVY